MLCSIQEKTNHKVIARAVEKSDGPFLCPSCRKELNVRKGQIKAHHFAHKSPVTCKYGSGESEAHRKAKWSIFDELNARSDVSYCELEKDLKTIRPDIYAVIRGMPVGIEVQISSLTLDQIIDRTEKYCQRNLAVLWLPLYTAKLTDEKYSPSAWERWLHAAYLGRVYYWLKGLSIVPIHFGEYKLWVEESSWYSEYGEEQSAGGYEKASKRFKTPQSGNPANIAQDFKVVDKDSWPGGKMNIPRRRILMDKQKTWWK